MSEQRRLSRRGFVGATAGAAAAATLVANPAGSFSTAERSYNYLASLRARH